MSLDKSLLDLFTGAIEIPDANERSRFLDEACGADAALRERVEKLLRAHDEAGGFFSQPSQAPRSAQATSKMALPVTEKPGTRIGQYKLLQQIGEGGCGVVYMAEQEEPVRRRVALKVIKLGMDTKQVIARFEAERQALALMDHPHIAKVLDAGATETGRLYFVMELVRGVKITDFCDSKNAGTSDRLNLFIEVCHAIQHSHQKGVIHRDIKPSNILVTTVDGVAMPKIIDFGIAKATNNQPLTDKTLFTAFEQFIGTPAYMSPEQAEMSGVDVDTRSDIYSLGVLLYELLTSRTPFDQKELLAAGLDGMRRTIREKEPPRPSARLSTMEADALTTTAEHRNTEPPKLVHQVRGDLDWIVMKCLEKERDRRYETANALATDIQRHLENEPVVARPPSRWYEFQKTVRRHKFGFAAATALVLALMLGVVISTWQGVRATRAEQLATDRLAEVEQARAEAEAISTFMSEVIRSPDPTRGDGRSIQVVELLDRAAKKLDTELADQPRRKATLQGRLGQTYDALGLYREAIPLQEEVRDYYVTTLGQEHSNTLRSLHNLAISYDGAGRRDEALKLREEVLSLRRKALGAEHPDTLYAMHALSGSYDDAGRTDEAIKLSEEALALCRKVLGPEHPYTLDVMNNVALCYQNSVRKGESLKIQEELVRLRRKVNGPEHPDTLGAMNNLANSYDTDRPDDALQLREEVLTLRRKVSGPEHPDTLSAMNNLAGSYFKTGRTDEAIKLGEEALVLCRKVLGPEHPGTIIKMRGVAISYDKAGRKGEAIKLNEEALALSRKVLGPEHRETLVAMKDLAFFYSRAGRQDEAIKGYEATLALSRKVLSPEHPETLSTSISLAIAYRKAGRTNEAIELGQSSLELFRRVSGSTHSETLNAMTVLAISFRVAGRIAEAIPLEEESLRLKRQHLPPGHGYTIESMQNLATCYEKTGRTPEGQALRREVAEFSRQRRTASSSNAVETFIRPEASNPTPAAK
jgi:serine/threonine protein kinase/tetratricopeptide (TPR) repeat protein